MSLSLSVSSALFLSGRFLPSILAKGECKNSVDAHLLNLFAPLSRIIESYSTFKFLLV